MKNPNLGYFYRISSLLFVVRISRILNGRKKSHGHQSHGQSFILQDHRIQTALSQLSFFIFQLLHLHIFY